MSEPDAQGRARRPTALRAAGADFWHFLTHYKAWWITPIVVILGVLGLVAAYSEEPAVVPFIYSVE